MVEKHGWKHYNMDALLAPPAESLMHRYILHSQKCEDHTSGKPAFRNLQGIALQISVTSRRNLLAQRAEEVSAGGESS